MIFCWVFRGRGLLIGLVLCSREQRNPRIVILVGDANGDCYMLYTYKKGSHQQISDWCLNTYRNGIRDEGDRKSLSVLCF